MSGLAVDVTEDRVLSGRLRLMQPRRGHRAGHDAILLAAATAVSAPARVVELGAGVGTAALALASRVPGIDLVMVEMDPELAQLARANAAANAIAAAIVVLDVTRGPAACAACGLPPDSVDVVLMNPPFNDPGRHRAAADQGRRQAHMAQEQGLSAWVGAAGRMLKSGGGLTLIWRADDLTELVMVLKSGFGSISLMAVHGVATRPAIRVLVHAVKGGKGGVRILTPLILNPGSGDDALPKPEDILSHGAALPLAAPARRARPTENQR
ncbi:MAG: methyltransferase [Alphaproteobacteria bacterium]|nr:methyltransferase [Alphaproteobacteria bacterium]